MKKYELSVGDCVFFDFNYLEDDPMYSKESFYPYKIAYGEDIDRAEEKTWCGNDIYQPIPINVVILLENGYKYDELTHGWYDKTGRAKVSVPDYPNTNRGWFVHVDTEDMDTMATFEIAYVHQLQHILRMCDMESDFEIPENTQYIVGNN